MDFPADNAFDIPVNPLDFTNEDFESAIAALLLATKELMGGKPITTLNVVSGSITPTQFVHYVDTGGPSTINLTQIDPSGLADGRWLALLPAHEDRTIVVVPTVNGYGSIHTVGMQSYSMDTLGKGILLRREGGQFKEQAFRAGQVVEGTRGQAKFTSNGNFTVPAGVTKIFVTMVGGGGGGGGGQGFSTSSNSTAAGSDGTLGGSSTFGGLTATGGPGGRAGQNTYGGQPVGRNSQRGWNGSLQGFGGTSIGNILGYGQGGAGGKGQGTVPHANHGGGGSSGAEGSSYYKAELSVTPGDVMPAVIGAGGAGGAGGVGVDGTGANGQAGANGLVLVEW